MLMMKLKALTAILFGACIILAFSGCAASSGSLRYHNESEKNNDNNSGTRFGSKTENKNTSGNIAEPIDTSNINDGVVDSDPDEIPVDKKKIDISTLIKKFSAEENNKNLTQKQVNAREKILMEIIKYLDTPYKYGGNTEDGIDCSAFTKSVYNKTLAIDLQRSAREQYQEGDIVSDKDELQFGDLVFFNTRRRVRPGHVGIYIGDHLFAHASSTNGVKVSSLDEDYYSARFMGGRRIKDIADSKTASAKN
jgi:cell wall-associated NlpC family hydrolase